MMNSTEYKKYHEAFMQDNHGTSAFHTFLCILFTVQSSVYISIQYALPTYSQYIREYAIIVWPMILAHTILADYIAILNCFMSVMLLHKCLLHYKNGIKNFQVKNIFKSDRLPIISCLRGLTYLITALCILAVDFHDFPRYLAKTERYGYSLMDTGVGLFVIISGMVHKDLSKNSVTSIIKSNIKFITVLFLLGVARFMSIKQLDYQEHVTEYGVHWNFFFTIAVCKIMSLFFLYLSNQALILSIVLLIVHEYVLYHGLQDWVFGDSRRDSLLSANREGLSSSLGYVSMYLFGVHIRQLLLNKTVTKYDILWRFLFGTLLLWVLTFTLNLLRPTSRTLANGGYCLFIETIVVSITAVIYFVTVLCEEKDNIQVPLILSTINSNGLTYFLVANLLTGAVNLSIRTLFVSSSVTFAILNIYMVSTFLLIVFLKNIGLTI